MQASAKRLPHTDSLATMTGGRVHQKRRQRNVATRRETNLCVLGDLDLPDQLTQGSTITGSVLSGDADLLRTLTHFEIFCGGGCKAQAKTVRLDDNLTTRSKIQQRTNN